VMEREQNILSTGRKESQNSRSDETSAFMGICLPSSPFALDLVGADNGVVTKSLTNPRWLKGF